MSQNQPLLPLPPVVTSKNENWQGLYLQHDRQPAFEIPEHSHKEHTLIIGMGNGLKA